MINRELIDPKSIVVVGGSNNVHKPGGRLVRNLLDGKYKGELYVVNAREDDVQGLKSYHSVQDIPDTEMAIISIPGPSCPEAVDILAKQKNVKAFIVVSAGFGEETHELAAALFFVGCDQKPQPAKTHATEVTVLEGKTMGTFWRASIPGIDAKRSAELKEKIQTQLDADDQLLSTYKKDSALMRFNDSQSLSPWPVSEAMADIVTTSLRIGAKTDGAMDITVGPLVNLWGFGPEQQPVQIPSQEQIDAMKAKTGLQHLTVINQSHQQYLQKDLPDLYVDLSTVGEGYAADHLARLMEQEGISRYLVSVGGALNSRGMNGEGLPWRVAIQKPTDKENAVQAVVDINGHGISTSGSYRNYYELDGKRLSHVIDPQTGRPIEHNLVSVTVIAPTALEADAWDTGLMVLGPEKAKEVVRREGLAVYMITKEGDSFKTWMSPQFKSFLVSEKN